MSVYRFPAIANPPVIFANQLRKIDEEIHEVWDAYTKGCSDSTVGIELLDVIQACETALRMLPRLSEDDVEELRAKVIEKNLNRFYYDEQWKPIEGLRNYEISNIGRVRNKNTGQIKTLNLRSNGYLYAHFTEDGKQYLKAVHRLVAKAFIPNPENKPFVNHIDGVKTNALPSNLEWCTPSENSKHAYETGLNRDSIHKAHKASMARSKEQKCASARKGSKKLMKPVIRNDGEIFESIHAAAEAIGSTPGNVHNTISGRYRTTKGYSFQYYRKAAD